MDEQEVSSYADNITDEDKAKQLKKDIKQRPESADRASRRYYKSQRKEGAKPDSQLSLFSDSKSTTLS